MYLNKIFPIGFGTGFNQEEYLNPKQIITSIQLAIDEGVNFFDTAESYGEGLAEKLLGKAIQKKRSNLFIASKFSPENASFKNIIKSCDNSLKRLKTDYIDLLQFHWPNPNIPLEESAKALIQLKKAGKIKYVGASNFSKTELAEIRKYLPVETLQTEFNIQEQFLIDSKLLNYCHKNNLKIIAYSPLDQGRLEYFNGSQQKVIKTLTQKYNKSFTQIVLNWIIHQKSQIIPIPKTINLDHLKQNIDSINFILTKDDQVLITNTFKPKIHQLPTKKILISEKGERNRGGYQTLDEAIKNPLNLVPGPIDLAKDIKKDKTFKPVRVIYNKKNKKYSLINGRVRYWAWVIAHGDSKPIPTYIREQ